MTNDLNNKRDPLFWYRPCLDGLYEGPHHNNSVEGKMLRDEKPSEWKPLYTEVGLTRDAIQKKALEHGFEYWRASDSHGVEGAKPQAIALLEDLIGVEVEIKDNGCTTCDGVGMIGGPSFADPGEGGVPCPDCALTAPVATEQAQAVAARWKLVPVEPTPEMVKAYLDANDAYWKRTDELPEKPGKWRQGTPTDATAESYRAMLAASPEAAPTAMEVVDPKKLGEDVARWTGDEYTAYRTDNGQPEQRVNVSVERLGHAVAAVIGTQGAATPAAPNATTVSWDWLRGVINGLPRTPSGCYELIARHDVLAWIDEGERRSRAALAQPAPSYRDRTPHLHVGESAFEDWYQNYLPNSVGHKQIARDAYAAGMGDPLVQAHPAPVQAPVSRESLVLVGAGALQMVVNALRRDAEEGKLARGEMVDALLASMHAAPVQQDAPAPSMVGDAKGGA